MAILATLAMLAAAVSFALAKTWLPASSTPQSAEPVSPAGQVALQLDEHRGIPFDAGVTASARRDAVLPPTPLPTAAETAAAEAALNALAVDAGAQKAGAVEAGTAIPTSPTASLEVVVKPEAPKRLKSAPIPSPPAVEDTLEPVPDAAVVAAVKKSPPRPVAPLGKPSCSRGMALISGPRPVCMDRYEYPNFLRSAPKGNFNAFKAKALCVKRGKRICRRAEWTRACQGGRSGRAFPYGSSYQSGWCNTSEEGRGGAVAPLNYKKCRSRNKVFALAGNLAEWTQTSSGFVLKGGSYARSGSESRCSAQMVRDTRVAQPEFGVRCCANPTYD
jgi:hypothetical protein